MLNVACPARSKSTAAIKCSLFIRLAPLMPNPLLPAGLLLLFCLQKTAQGAVCPELLLKKSVMQKMGYWWLIVVGLPVQMPNPVQLFIVLPSAQKQTGGEHPYLRIAGMTINTSAAVTLLYCSTG